jgi:hypothetical protein
LAASAARRDGEKSGSSLRRSGNLPSRGKAPKKRARGALQASPGYDTKRALVGGVPRPVQGPALPIQDILGVQNNGPAARAGVNPGRNKDFEDIGLGW